VILAGAAVDIPAARRPSREALHQLRAGLAHHQRESDAQADLAAEEEGEEGGIGDGEEGVFALGQESPIRRGAVVRCGRFSRTGGNTIGKPMLPQWNDAGNPED
jgi:hypothetical protein